MANMITVWDGLAFKLLPKDEAYQLQAEDKVQVCDRIIAGHEYKHRSQFLGYLPPPEPPVSPPPPPPPPPPETPAVTTKKRAR